MVSVEKMAHVEKTELDFQYEYEYDGMRMIPMFPASSLDKIKGTAFHDDDIIVATYPKCGTTWMQQIVFMIQNEGDAKESENIPLHKRWHFIEQVTPEPDGKVAFDTWASKPPPQLVKTHLSTTFYQKTLKEKKTKFIVVLRNPKDALVSYYNFYKINDVFDFKGNWDDFFQIFKEKKIVHGDCLDVQLSWWKLHDDPRVLVLTFEDMLKTPEDSIRKVMKHLGKSLPDNVVKNIVIKTSFKSMKDNPLTNYSDITRLDLDNGAFMRKGKVGDWKNYFSKEQAEYVNNLSATIFEPEGLFMKDQ